MGRKSYIGLSAFLIFVLTLLCLVLLPLQVWSKQIQIVLPKGVQVRGMSGHWWKGQTDIILPSLSEPMRFSWSTDSFFEPLNWQISHPELVGAGQLQPSLNSLSVWVSGLKIKTELLKPPLASQSILISGKPIELTRGFAVYGFDEEQFSVFRLQAQWSEGVIRYQENNQLISANINDWRLHGFLESPSSDESSNTEPVLLLLSEQNSPLFEVRIRAVGEIEMTVMPELLETFGIHWSGQRSYPAFVIVHPILNIFDL